MNPLTLVKRKQSINAKESDLGISEEASWHAKYKNSAYVFVGGLPYDLTEGDLLAVFAKFCNKKQMTVLKRYVLRLFMSIKYITANVIDRNNGRVVTTASTVEHSIKNSLECGRTCNAKAAAIVGEVLAMRLKVEGLQDGQGRGIHADVKKEIEKKGFKSRTKVWAVINSLRNNGVTLVLDDYDDVVDKAYHDRPYGDHR